MRRSVLTVAGWLALLVASGPRATAEVFLLHTGGSVTGEFVNRDEVPRKKYVVQTAEGAQITLDVSQVQQVLRPRPDEVEYEKIRPSYADTVAGQWDLAQWCRAHHLTAQRETHLQRVIDLDPNHAEARRALGYSRVDGQWVTRDEVMTQRGYQRYKGQWKPAQEIELLENKQKLESSQQTWFRDIKLWRSWLDTERDEQARENFDAIHDPAAVKALKAALAKEPSVPVRLLYVEILARIDTVEAAKFLAEVSLKDKVEEVRLTCLDHLAIKPHPAAVDYYVRRLRDKKSSNEMVNLAGLALGRMKDPAAIKPLIDAVVTYHTFKISKPGGDDATSASFGGGPGHSGMGLSAGGGPQYVRRAFSNQPVLNALVALTGQDFGFDQQAWNYWYAATQKKSEALDARRN